MPTSPREAQLPTFIGRNPHYEAMHLRAQRRKRASDFRHTVTITGFKILVTIVGYEYLKSLAIFLHSQVR